MTPQIGWWSSSHATGEAGCVALSALRSAAYKSTSDGTTSSSETAELSMTRNCSAPVPTLYGAVCVAQSAEYAPPSRYWNHPAPARLQISWLPRTKIHGAAGRSLAIGVKKSAFQLAHVYTGPLHAEGCDVADGEVYSRH